MKRQLMQCKTTQIRQAKMLDMLAVGSVLQWLTLPLAATAGYFFRKLIVLDVRTAVLESKMNDIKEDIHEIKRGIAKLVDRNG